jgi:hypothetical protein
VAATQETVSTIGVVPVSIELSGHDIAALAGVCGPLVQQHNRNTSSFEAAATGGVYIAVHDEAWPAPT